MGWRVVNGHAWSGLWTLSEPKIGALACFQLWSRVIAICTVHIRADPFGHRHNCSTACGLSGVDVGNPLQAWWHLLFSGHICISLSLLNVSAWPYFWICMDPGLASFALSVTGCSPAATNTPMLIILYLTRARAWQCTWCPYPGAGTSASCYTVQI